MTHDERELIEEKFSGLHAAIIAWQNIQKLTDENIKEKLDQTITLQKLTNGRVTCLEDKSRFWFWFSNKPVRLAIFFLIPIFLGYIFSIESIWAIVEKIFKLL